jgi:hypothetical protein
MYASLYKNVLRFVLKESNEGASRISHGTKFHRVSDNANINHHSCSNLCNTYKPPSGYEYDIPQTKALLGGSEYFTPTEIEVFRR